MIIKEEINNLIHFNFYTQQQLGLSILRPEEFTENAHFKGKVFSLQEYIDWEVKTKGYFDYLDAIQGINIPGKVLRHFYNGEFDPLSDSEKWFLDKVTPFSSRLDNIYIIGTYGRRTRVHVHEEAHGLYYIDKEYKSRADQITSTLTKRNRNTIEKMLRQRAYASNTWDDEIQAYLVDGDYKFPQGRALRKLFKQHRAINLK